jgi:hypothetical protein
MIYLAYGDITIVLYAYAVACTMDAYHVMFIPPHPPYLAYAKKAAHLFAGSQNTPKSL